MKLNYTDIDLDTVMVSNVVVHTITMVQNKSFRIK